MDDATTPPAPSLLTGHCLCGSVRFRITARLGAIGFCHCSQCRRASGSAFATNANVRRDEIHFDAGRDGIREYESSPGKYRAFCPGCGSPIYSRTDGDGDHLRVRLGHTRSGPRPTANGACLGRLRPPGTRSATRYRSSPARRRRAHGADGTAGGRALAPVCPRRSTFLCCRHHMRYA